MSNRLIKIAARTTFDLDKVQRAIEKPEKEYLFRVGGFALKTAKRLIKSGKTIYSKPGDPPRSKTGALRNGIAFSVQMQERSVIIGPRRDTKKENSLVLHEYGGTVRRKAGYVLIPTREIRESDLVDGYPVEKSRKRAHSRVFLPAGTRNYAPRPYMQPALEKTLDQDQARFWRGAR